MTLPLPTAPGVTGRAPLPPQPGLGSADGTVAPRTARPAARHDRLTGGTCYHPQLFSPAAHRLPCTVGVVNIFPAHALATGDQQPGHAVTGQGHGVTGQGHGVTGQGHGVTGQGHGVTGQGHGVTGRGGSA